MISGIAPEKETNHSSKINPYFGSHVTTRTISDSLFAVLVKFVNEGRGSSLRADMEKIPIEQVVPSFTVYPGDLKNFTQYRTLCDLKNRNLSGPVFWFRHFGIADTSNLHTILLYARFLSVQTFLLKRISSDESLLFIFPKKDIIASHNTERSETPILFILPNLALLNANIKNSPK